jgi:ribonuclease P protein component
VLSAANRLRRRQDFTAAVRRGRRAGRPTLVVHLRLPSAAERAAPGADRALSALAEPRVGLVVGRAVGPAVVRSQVKRRLRHVLRSRLALLPAGSLLVVRALPAAATATSAALAADIDKALARVTGSAGPRSSAPGSAAEGAP